MNNQSGIYEILNTVNGKRYIGQTTLFSKRWNRHRNSLRKGTHTNQHLQNAWDRDGEKAFKFAELGHCPRGDMTLCEQAWMDLLPHEYNKAPAAGTVAGYKHTPGFCDKMRGNKRALGNTSSLGKKHPPEFGAAITARQLGRKMPAEAIEKSRRARIGTKRSAKSCAKQSATLRGRILPDEWCENISKGLIGKKHPPERCEANRRGQLGTKRTAEHAANISKGNKGRKKSPRTPEHTANHAAAVRRGAALRRAAKIARGIHA